METKSVQYLSTLVALSLLIGSLFFVVSCDSKTTEPKLQIETPEFNPEGGTYIDSVQVTIVSETEEVEIFYTVDGEEPTSNALLYTAPILIDSTLTLKARAYREGWEESDIRSELYEIDYTEEPDQLPKPIFDPDGGTYLYSVNVTISSEPEDAVVHYTLDGSEPTRSSTLYTEPMIIDTTSTLKARAFKEGWLSSEIKASFYEVEHPDDPEQVALPKFDPQPGSFLDSILVSISCETEDALIYYTVNGDEPTQSSKKYSDPVIIETTTTLKTKAFKSGMLPSEVNKGVYSIFYQVATPTFSLEPGQYDKPQQVEILCATPDALIYFTTDGSDPDESSVLYTSPIEIEETTTIKAKAYKEDWLPSETASAAYEIKIDSETVATPTFDPPGGQYNEVQQVEIHSDTPGAQIRYTTTGSEPTENSPLFENPIEINTRTTLRARAFKDGWNPSKTAVAVYDLKAATPTFNPSAGIYEEAQRVQIASATPETRIHYTTNGADPTIFSRIYSSPIDVNRDTTIKAMAIRSNWTPSDIAKAEYKIDYPEIKDMVPIPAGSFMMGDARNMGSPNARPAHNVNLSGFYIGKYQVTQKQWEQVMGSNPSGFLGEDRPVDSVSWYYALIYCNRRSIAEDLTPVYTISNSTDPDDWGEPPYMGYDRDWDNPRVNFDADGYRLPTEAEWEYAARAATNTPDYTYSGSDNVDLVAWHNGNSDGTSHPVGRKDPNGLNIYGMSGNVWEWCHDWYDEDYYENSPENNPTGPDSGSFRVIRGGSWSHSAEMCRVFHRMNGFPYRANNFMGLRVVRSIR